LNIGKTFGFEFESLMKRVTPVHGAGMASRSSSKDAPRLELEAS
jgi:hypothetical protein